MTVGSRLQLRKVVLAMNNLLPHLKNFLLITMLVGLPVQGLAQWESVAGPNARNISAFLVDTKSPSRLYAGLQSGEFFSSTDDGRTWERLSSISRDETVHQLLQDPERPEHLYAATGSGFYISSDGGKRWEGFPIVPGSQAPEQVKTIALDPWKPRILYAGVTHRGIYKSSNGGKTWSPANGEPADILASAEVFDIKLDTRRPDVLYAAVSGLGIIRSTDDGNSWGRLTEEFTPTSANATHIVLHPKAEGTILYGTATGGIARSEDGGKTWSPSRHHSDFGRIVSLCSYSGEMGIVFAGTETGGLVSPDFGSTWKDIGGNLPHLPVTLNVSPKFSGYVIYAYGPGTGLQRSTDGGSLWQRADAGLGGARVTLVSTDRSGERLYAVCNGALLFNEVRSQTWRPASEGLTGEGVRSLAFGFDSSTLLYATTPSGTFMTTNGGERWLPAARTVRMTPTFIDTHPSIATRMYASGEQGVSVSTDRGNSWIQGKPLGGKFNVHSLTFIPTNAGRIIGATSNSAIIVSNDGGFNWESARYGIMSNEIFAVTLDDSDAQTLYAYSPAGDEYRSTNAGLEWNPFLPPWSRGDTVRVAFDRFQPSSVVALVNARDVYYSQSGGGTWFKILQSRLPGDALCISWNGLTETLYAGTRNRGVYRLTLESAIRELLEER